MVDELSEKDYVPFVINRALSYFNDCVFHANEMNMYASLPKQAQYSYFLNTIRPRKRFAGKWIKQEQSETIEAVAKYYGYSYEKAVSVMHLLTPENIEKILELTNEGGRK